MPGEVAIIGAGPAGLATAACLRVHDIAYRLIDRSGEPGGAYQTIYPRTVLASPARYSALPGFALDHAGEYITAGRYLAYLESYAAHHEIAIERGEVARVERRGDTLLVESSEVRAVVVATGMFGSPRLVPVAGTPSIPVVHARDWKGPDELGPGALVIVGGGTSAVEIAEQTATTGRRVVVASRRPVKLVRQRFLGRDIHALLPLFEWIPPWVARGYCRQPSTLPAFDAGFRRLEAAGLITVRSGELRVDGNRVRVGSEILEAAAIVCATGYQFDVPFVPREVARAPGGHLRAKANESVSWPGLFVIGAPCARGLASEFLRGIARDAVAIADALRARA